jgi:hypothetical protein
MGAPNKRKAANEAVIAARVKRAQLEQDVEGLSDAAAARLIRDVQCEVAQAEAVLAQVLVAELQHECDMYPIEVARLQGLCRQASEEAYSHIAAAFGATGVRQAHLQRISDLTETRQANQRTLDGNSMFSLGKPEASRMPWGGTKTIDPQDRLRFWCDRFLQTIGGGFQAFIGSGGW